MQDSRAHGKYVHCHSFSGTPQPNMIAFWVNNGIKMIIGEHEIKFEEKTVCPVDGKSSGNFTHCHVTEPEDQAVDWANLVGRCVKSSGNYRARALDGAKIDLPKDAPTSAHGMVTMELC